MALAWSAEINGRGRVPLGPTGLPLAAIGGCWWGVSLQNAYLPPVKLAPANLTSTGPETNFRGGIPNTYLYENMGANLASGATLGGVGGVKKLLFLKYTYGYS